MRGNPDIDCRKLRLKGPIPACAGQPRGGRGGISLKRAYPRVCGATFFGLLSSFFRLGLSPRVRGNQVITNLPLNLDGPIPACAGQPAVVSMLFSLVRAYPRVCGATQTTGKVIPELKGLSPRVRGNR